MVTKWPKANDKVASWPGANVPVGFSDKVYVFDSRRALPYSSTDLGVREDIGQK